MMANTRRRNGRPGFRTKDEGRRTKAPDARWHTFVVRHSSFVSEFWRENCENYIDARHPADHNWNATHAARRQCPGIHRRHPALHPERADRPVLRLDDPAPTHGGVSRRRL